LHLNPPDESSDVFSFAMVLWTMVAWEELWRGMSSLKVSQAIAEEKQRPECGEITSDPLRNLLRVCWAHNKESRPSFAQIKSELSLLVLKAR
jgi:hypothetical protein